VKWSGELSKAGDTILHQHAIQGDITPVQQAVWYVNVFHEFHCAHVNFCSPFFCLFCNNFCL